MSCKKQLKNGKLENNKTVIKEILSYMKNRSV